MKVVHNALGIAAKFRSKAVSLDDQVGDVLAHHAAMLETRIKRHASGRPGPNIISGDYRRSIQRQRIKGGWVVGTNQAQGRRLEYGFFGEDSMGRTYSQQPYPHFGPAVDETRPELLKDLRKTVGEL